MMVRPRWASARALAATLVGGILLAAAGLAFVAERKPETPPPPAARETGERPILMLLTSLPLVFGESFGIDAGGSPALRALEARYKVEPVAVADAGNLERGGLLLMAHPLAQPAEALVELDAWVRGGGRLLLLADPALDWHSDRPLGDAFRPPPAFADTGLLAHWGLRLDAPEERGPREGRLGGYRILAGSPGSLAGKCAEPRGLVARCRIGKGEVTVVADADFLNVADLDGPTRDNLTALIAELAALERRGAGRESQQATDLSTREEAKNK